VAEVKGGDRKSEGREAKLEIDSQVAGETVCGGEAKLAPQKRPYRFLQNLPA